MVLFRATAPYKDEKLEVMYAREKLKKKKKL